MTAYALVLIIIIITIITVQLITKCLDFLSDLINSPVLVRCFM